MKLRLSGRQLFIFSLLILLTALLIGSVSLTYPYGRDQAFYAYAGKLLLQGKMSYLHVFDLKPPGSHLFFAMEQLILGESMLNARIFDIFWQALTAIIIFLVSFRLTGNKILSYISSFMYLLLYFRQDYWHTLQADGMLNLPLALAVLLLILSFELHSFTRVFLAGFAFGCALLFKYTVISFLPLVIVCFLFSKKEPVSIRLKNSAVFILGIILLCGITALWYSSAGALKDMIDIQFGQTSEYTKIAYETESGEFIFKHIFRLFTYSVYSPLIWASFAGILILLLKKRLQFPQMLILAWAVSSLFSLIVQWKFYHYHFLVIIAALSVGAVVFAAAVMEFIKPGRKKTAVIILALFFAGFVIYSAKPYAESYSILADFVSGKQTLKEAYIKNGFTSDSVFMAGKTFNAVDFVNQNSAPADKIYLWGYDPMVYYLSGRECVSRFVYHIPLLWKAENTSFRNEFMGELNKHNPKLVIIASNDPLYYISGYHEDSKQLLERFHEFKNFIDSKYTFIRRIDDYDFYELKNW